MLFSMVKVLTDIESTANHVIDQHIALAGRLLVQTIYYRRSDRFVDNPEHILGDIL